MNTQRLITLARAQAKELDKDPEERSDALDDESVAWTLRELAMRIEQLEAKTQ